MRGEGRKRPLLMFIGVSPAEDDDRIGRPYTGPTGRLLYALLEEAGISRNEIYITNAVKCASDDPKKSHWLKCQRHLKEEIEEIKPRAIVSIGASAASWLTGFSVMKVRRRALPCTLTDDRGQRIPINVYPIPQPTILWKLEGKQKDAERKNLIEDLEWIKDQVLSGEPATKRVTDYRVATSLDDVDKFLEECSEAIRSPDGLCFDFETNKLGRPYKDKGDHLVAVGFSLRPYHALAIPLQAKAIKTPMYWPDDVLPRVQERVARFMDGANMFGHMAAQFDSMWAIECLGVRPNIVFDTAYAHYTIDEEPPHNLEALALRYTNMGGWKSKFNLEDPYKLCEYLYQDVDATSRLAEVFRSQMGNRENSLLKRLILPLAKRLLGMSMRGVRINEEKRLELEKRLDEKIQELLKTFRKFPEVQAWELARNEWFNPDSRDQLAEVMRDYFKFREIKQTATGKYGTGDEVLEQLQDKPFISAVRSYRTVSKLKDTFVTGLGRYVVKPEGLAHTTFHPLTVTGRCTSEDPGLHQIPTKGTAGDYPIKSLFEPRFADWCLLQVDISQAELRILACLSGDAKMLEIFRNGLDIHRASAAQVFGISQDEVSDEQRRAAKAINFGIVYGKSEETLVQDFINAAQEKAFKEKRKLSVKERLAAEELARNFYRMHQKTFTGVWGWLDEQKRIIRRRGYQETHFGRRRYYRKVDAEAERKAMNFPIQSTASDITEVSIVRTDLAIQEAGLQGFQVLTVHDSILFETPLSEMWDLADCVYDTMTNLDYDWLTVPWVVDFEAGFNWGEMRKLDMQTREIK